jgi:hypothetical protein
MQKNQFKTVRGLLLNIPTRNKDMVEVGNIIANNKFDIFRTTTQYKVSYL